MKKYFAITAISLFTLLSCTSEKASSVSADTAAVDTSFTTEVQEPVVDSITTSIPNTDNVSQSSQTKQPSGCNFEPARKKALDKLEKVGLIYVKDEELGSQENSEDCKVTYRFYVKEIGYDLDGNRYTKDKIKLVFLTYKLLSSNFEFIEGMLFDSATSNRYRTID